MGRMILAAAIVAVVVVVVGAVVFERRGAAEGPELAGSWTVTEGGGQPDYLLVMDENGSAIATSLDVVPYIGAWEVEEGTFSITLNRLSDPGGGGAQGFGFDGDVAALDDGQISIGGGAWVLRPITAGPPEFGAAE